MSGTLAIQSYCLTHSSSEISPTWVSTRSGSRWPALKSERWRGRIVYFSGRAELTTGEMRDAGKRGPEAGGGAKGLEEEVVGFVHILFVRGEGDGWDLLS